MSISVEGDKGERVRDLGFNVADYTQSYEDVISNIAKAAGISEKRAETAFTAEHISVSRLEQTLSKLGFPDEVLKFYVQVLKGDL